MAEIFFDYTACIVSGGSELKNRIEDAAAEYSPLCGEYFAYLYGKNGRNGEAFIESACGFLLLDILLKKNGVDRLEVAVARNSDGRPCVINRNDIDFSISHSEGAAFCCVAIGENARVGADIQRVRTYSREYMEQLARTFMSKSQLESFLVSSEREKYFYTAWTDREAAYKRCGSYHGVTEEFDGAPAQGEFRNGIITACGSRYYYSISLPERTESGE
ncbi:MAG: 4'-phosphopantetheinyl transferase family protein [Oscillospiraceae bacterium]